MEIRSEIINFLYELENSSRRTFLHKREMGELIELAWSTTRPELLEGAAFHAKFVTRAFEIMRRIGRDADGYTKMEAEFKTSSEKAMTLMRTLVKEAPDDVKQKFMQQFFAPTDDNLARLLQLFAELAWIKNWMVDGKPLPWQKS